MLVQSIRSPEVASHADTCTPDRPPAPVVTVPEMECARLSTPSMPVTVCGAATVITVAELKSRRSS